MEEKNKKPIVPVPPVPPVIVQGGVQRKQVSETTRMIRSTCAWIVIISAVAFAFIAILGIWDVFGSSAGDVVGRSLTSLFVIGFAAAAISVVSAMIDENKR